MTKKVFFILISVCFGTTLLACGPSQAEKDSYATEVAQSIFATQTAEAPTHTPTFTPTATPTPTPTLPPVPAGWQGYSSGNFYIALPEGWQVVDVEEEGIEAILQFLKTLNTEWAQNAASMFTTEGILDLLKFWAIDSKPAGIGYASINLIYHSQQFPINVEDWCAMMPSLYEQMGIELIEVNCDLEINGIEVARLTSRAEVGTIGLQQYQFIFVLEKSRWTLSAGVDETAWAEYEPIFTAIAESFRTE